MEVERLLASGGHMLLDGAMGTELAARGLEMGGQTCLSHPEAVLEIHSRYIAAGCQALTTNTLTMNGMSMRRHGIQASVAEVNLAGARLARSAGGEGIPVLGNLSATGALLEPYGEATAEELTAVFREQAAALRDGGVDGFILETYVSLAEALCALRACREAAELPVIVTLSFSTTAGGGRTVMGDAAATCARALEAAGAAAVGANCGGLDPAETAAIITAMRPATSLPLVAQPNAGRARLEGGRTLFNLGPGDFAQGIAAASRPGRISWAVAAARLRRTSRL